MQTIRGKPIKDDKGEIYDYERLEIPSGEYAIKLGQISDVEKQALIIANALPDKRLAQKTLEELSKIKPMAKANDDFTHNVKIKYLTVDLVEEGISQVVIEEAFRHYRKNSESRFFPDHSEFLNYCIKKQKIYRVALEKSNDPNRVELFDRPAPSEGFEKAILDYIGKPKWQCFLKQCLLEKDGSVISIKVPSRFIAEYIENHLSSVILRALYQKYDVHHTIDIKNLDKDRNS